MPELATRAAVRTVPALRIDGLSYRYPNADAPALSGIDLSVDAGEFAVLCGRSTCGKSTLLRAACGLVPHFHGGELEGRVAVGGVDALEQGPGKLAALVGYVAQDPETQIVSTTVAAELELPLELHGHPATARARAVEEVALSLAIPHLLSRPLDTLSGGELQRVALAAALVTRPKLILLDEPTSQLDPVAGDELIWLLRRLNEEWGVSVLLAEHRLERCLAAADRVVAMDGGRIAFDGLPADFLAWALDHDPTLSTPGARLFSLAGIDPLPVGVRAARKTLVDADQGAGVPMPPRRELPASASTGPGTANADLRASRARRGGSAPPPALNATDLWVELDRGDAMHDVLKGIDLRVEHGERVALMGRNGAGKSTLLRTAAGLIKPVHGRLAVAGGCALLTQNPGDYLVRERVADELPGEAGMAALEAVGLGYAGEMDPRDMSGGERQRLALAITLAGRGQGDELPGLVALDEPTRGMDRGRKEGLTRLARELSDRGAAVVIATHDVEFAASIAGRVVLLGDGVVIADGPAAEVLSGGWYFATETARILGLPGVISPDQGAAALIGEHP